MRLRNLILLCIILMVALSSHASVRLLTTATQVKTALPNAVPGDTILLADGDYNLSWLKLSCVGTPAQPIIIAAQNLLGARVIGSGCITLINAAYVEFHGLDFDQPATSSIFKLQGAHHIRISHNRFRMSKDNDTQTSKWILIGDIWENNVCLSGHNRIDYNLFENKQDGGALIVIDGAHGTPGGISVHDTIDHNIFRVNGPRANNEKETVRIGVSDLSMDTSYTVVAYNLFEDCDGDPEVVSVKSCCNTINNNTFRRCLGTLCLRHGFNNTAIGNIFLGENKTAVYEGETIGCGGIRIYGKDHTVSNNYFENLTGSKWDPAIALTCGDAINTVSASSKHFLPENVQVTNNTFVRCHSTLECGFTNNGKYTKKPLNCFFTANTVVANQQAILMYQTLNSSNVAFSGNSAYLEGDASIGISYTPAQFNLLTTAPVLPDLTGRIMTDNNAGPYASEQLWPDALENVKLYGNKCKKMIYNGQLVIIHDKGAYTILGARIK